MIFMIYLKVDKEKDNKQISKEEKKELWDKFYINAPRQRTQQEKQYSNQKRVWQS